MVNGKREVIYTASPEVGHKDIYCLQYEAAELTPPEWFDVPASRAGNAFNAKILADATAERLRCRVRVVRITEVD